MSKSQQKDRAAIEAPVALKVFAALREVADDPDRTEGELRDTLRSTVVALERQHEVIERYEKHSRRMARHFAILAGLFFLIAAWTIGREFWPLASPPAAPASEQPAGRRRSAGRFPALPTQKSARQPEGQRARGVG